jgi:hypothetical protein
MLQLPSIERNVDLQLRPTTPLNEVGLHHEGVFEP